MPQNNRERLRCAIGNAFGQSKASLFKKLRAGSDLRNAARECLADLAGRLEDIANAQDLSNRLEEISAQEGGAQ